MRKNRKTPSATTEEGNENYVENFAAIAELLSCVQLFWDSMDCSLPGSSLSLGFRRQEYWSGLPFPSPGDVPDPGIKPASPALAGRFFTTEPPVYTGPKDVAWSWYESMKAGSLNWDSA